MDQKDQKKAANPLYLRPYSSSSSHSLGASSNTADASRTTPARFTPRLGSPTDAPSQPARRFTPKAPASPTRRTELKQKKEDETNAEDIFERMEASGKFDDPVVTGPAPSSYAQRSYPSANRIRFNASQQAFAQSRMPVGAKKTGGNSKPLQNVSFGLDGKYRPITIPFYQCETDGTTTTVPLDEDDDASKLFRENGQWIEDQLILIQMPIILPDPVDPRDEALNANASGLHKIPDGKIGKLRTYKSGKVKLEIGGVLFDVSKGCDMKCHQEVCCVAPDQNVCMFMGPIPSRVVVTPDLSSVLVDRKSDAGNAK